MADKLDDVWDSRDFPVLREAARICDADTIGAGARLHDIATATGLSTDDTFLALRALEDSGLIEMRWVMPAHAGRVKRVSAEARRLVGPWPTPETALERMIAALDAIAETPTTRTPEHAPARSSTGSQAPVARSASQQ